MRDGMKIIRMMALPILLTVHGLAWGDWGEGLAAYRRGDYDAALREWRPLAEQGYDRAQYSLGLMYINGQGVHQDYKEAMKWFRKAAEQGFASAQFDLGVMYHNGEGVSQDYVQAFKWFNIAGANGNEGGNSKRGLVAIKMTPAQVAEAKKLAREWMEKHP
jgi:hypothetical protein